MMNNDPWIYLVGDEGTGILGFEFAYLRLNSSNPDYKPVADDTARLSIKLTNNININVNIADSYGGNLIDKSLHEKTLELCDAFMVFYSINDQITFRTASEFLSEIATFTEGKIIAVLIGNNCESPNRVVQYEDGKALADKYKIPFFEVSTKNMTNVNEAMQSIGMQLQNKNSDTNSNSEGCCRI